MAVRTLDWFTLHKRQPNTTEQEKLFTGQGKLTIATVVDLCSTQRLAEQLGCALKVTHDEGEMTDASDGHVVSTLLANARSKQRCKKQIEYATQ
jgi:hypothetical protein